MTSFYQDAFKASREYLDTDNRHGQTSELQQALAHKAAGNWSQLPQASSDEAELFIQRTKPERYAHLASLIAVLFNHSFASSGSESAFILPPSVSNAAFPWHEAYDHFTHRLRENAESIGGTAEYQSVQQIASLVGTLSPGRHIYCATQLQAGINTAYSTMLPILRNLPAICRYYQPSFEAEDLAKIAYKSSGLVHTLMRRSVENMMASRRALTSDKLWFDNVVLEPGHFEPILNEGRIHLVRFRDLDNIEIDGRKVKELDGNDSTTVGCPLSVLRGTYKNLWLRTVQAIDSARLWDIDPQLQSAPI